METGTRLSDACNSTIFLERPKQLAVAEIVLFRQTLSVWGAFLAHHRRGGLTLAGSTADLIQCTSAVGIAIAPRGPITGPT